MDAERFDHFSRLFALPTSRRKLLGRAGRLLGLALGVAAAGNRVAEAQSDENTDSFCTFDLVANIRISPEGIVLIPEDDDALQGQLTFSLADDGALDEASFAIDNGSERTVLGQADGHEFSARIDFLPGRVLILVGVGQFPISECRGQIDGVLTGPEMGALGDWHAVATASAPRQPGDTTPDAEDEGDQSSSGGNGSSGGGSGSGTAGNTTETEDECDRSCPGELTLDSTTCECECAGGFQPCGDACVDLSTDPDHCGACNEPCQDGAACTGGQCRCQTAGCNPGAVVDLQTCACTCPPDWADCGEECCQPGQSCAGPVCCDFEGTACASEATCCSGTCDFLVGGGTCAPCQGRTCSADRPCCGGQVCTNGYCGGCRDRAVACTTNDQCCFSDCTSGACLSDQGGPCARNADCRECYLSGNCQRACLLGTCGGTLLPDAPIDTEIDRG